MTVAELIVALQALPPDAVVVYHHVEEDGYCDLVEVPSPAVISNYLANRELQACDRRDMRAHLHGRDPRRTVVFP